ncbi:MAG: hypothetical protein Ta2B_07310 [Termitinemataceae bacterium]|nr:MAG: hypothetical protein Ta2B_07310 [Termitinemataceae bacterium]
MSKCNTIANRGMAASMLRLLLCPKLTVACIYAIGTIISKFFILQYRAAMNPKKHKITNVEHPLDIFIPFDPHHTEIYLDFSPFWVRTQAFLIENFCKSATNLSKEFILSMAKLYVFAAQIYKKNFSTTRRPKLNSECPPQLKMVHTVDPHLMCVPSLHIMVIVWTYRKMQFIMSALGADKEYEDQLQGLKLHAIAIAESVLYVKQHSINCISAALYTLYCLDPVVVPKNEALDFLDCLFKNASDIAANKRQEIITYMKNLYCTFINERELNEDWRKPILDFLENYTSGHT